MPFPPRAYVPLALGLLFVACGAADRPRNLILISVDTLRADRLGCYGYERPTSPALDRIAAEGVLFEEAYSTSPWTLPSHASLFTGLYPRQSGAVGMSFPIADEVDHIAELLGRAGFTTAAIVSSSILTGAGLERGFATLEYVEPGGTEPSGVTTRVLEWLEERDPDQPFLLLVHYLDPHSDYGALPEFAAEFVGPYDGPADGTSAQLFQHVRGEIELTTEDAAHLSDLYDAGVRQFDEELRRLFERLEGDGLLEESLVVLTSDHGEEFLEHGNVMHGPSQYEESVRIPLVFTGAGVPSELRIAEPVSLVDVLPTCMDLLGLRAPADLDGVSLRAAWEEPGREAPARSLYLEADLDPPPPDKPLMVRGTERAIRRGRFKLHYDLATNVSRLYDLEQDPEERIDVRKEHPEIAREMLADLKAFLRERRTVAPRTLTSEHLKDLQDLGYAGSSGVDGD